MPRDLAAITAATFLRSGADTGETGPILVSRGEYGFLHGAMTEQRLGPGDVLHVELIPKVGGYSARLMRPIAIGDPDDATRSSAGLIVELQDRQIAAMRPGVLASEVDTILRQGLRASGLRSRFDNVTGYTLGLYGRTPRPSDFSRVLLPDADWRLQPGMVFHVYASADGLGFSETVVVETTGPRRLTRATRQILTR